MATKYGKDSEMVVPHSDEVVVEGHLTYGRSKKIADYILDLDSISISLGIEICVQVYIKSKMSHQNDNDNDVYGVVGNININGNIKGNLLSISSINYKSSFSIFDIHVTFF
ncbi:uncharacterized protein LOC131644364 [Vicia villosa]|uniref:uncharacterized protein LOC131644364 n=1 Tax=Vicia villosa TaxID=3911 RepID=UPI00273C25E4|nr:uncharacterized protein LOC131644364 [Vicia villosa]